MGWVLDWASVWALQIPDSAKLALQQQPGPDVSSRILRRLPASHFLLSIGLQGSGPAKKVKGWDLASPKGMGCLLTHVQMC